MLICTSVLTLMKWNKFSNYRNYWNIILVTLTVLISKSCHHKIPQTGWLKKTEMLFSHFWKLEVWNQGVRNTGAFLLTQRENLYTSLLVLVTVGNSQCSLVSGGITPISALGSHGPLLGVYLLVCSSFYKDLNHVGLRFILNQYVMLIWV